MPLAEVTAEFRRAWRELAEAAVEPNPFYEADAVLDAAALLPDGAATELLVVQAEDGPDLHLVLPVLRSRSFRRVPVPALLAWQHPYCYLGVPLARPDVLHEAWGEVLDLGREPTVEPWLVLPQLPLHNEVGAALQDVLAARYVRAAALDVFGRPVLRRRPSCTYLDGRFSPRHRKSLRRHRRRLADALGGQVDVLDAAQGAGDLKDAVHSFLQLEAAGWKGRAGTAMASRAGDAEWFRRLALSLHRERRLQLWALGTAERVAAWQCNILTGETVFHFKIAYDEALAKSSPGLQLEVAMVEEFHGDTRLRRLDSCVNADNRVSAQLYPDREVLGTLVVPLHPVRGRFAVGAARAASGLRSALAQLRGRTAVAGDTT